MADHSPTVPSVPDYKLADELVLGAEQTKLMLHPTRLRIIDLLGERAATTSQLADALGQPKGTVGHHCKALEAAGLTHVVRTAKVRAIEERYYGRTARLFIVGDFEKSGVMFGSFLGQAWDELVAAASKGKHGDEAHTATARYARIPRERAQEWADRLNELAMEFASQDRDGDTTYGLLVGLFDTDRKPLS